MPYLTRRLKKLFDDLKSGRLQLTRAVAPMLENSLAMVQFTEGGDPVLQSVPAEIRSLARTYELTQQYLEPRDGSSKPHQLQTPNGQQISSLTHTLFQLYEDIFVAATEKSPLSFAPTPESFRGAIRALGGRLKGDPSGDWGPNLSRATNALATFYRSSGLDLLRGAGKLPGYKLVLGGKQNFGGSSLAAARSMLLYADTLLVPDPVSRWFESEHSAEGFAFPRMLEDLYFLLQLRPIADAQLPYPALVIFPSLEHALEENDQVTRDREELMALDFFSHYLECSFEDLEEVETFVDSRESEFIEAIQKHRLFVPMGGSGSEEFRVAIDMQKTAYKGLRSAAFFNSIEKMPPSRIAFVAILERLAPQYHMADNAESLNASPLMSLPVHWHYSTLLREARASVLPKMGDKTPSSTAIIQALAGLEYAWLGNVPMEQIIDLRKRGENEQFRKRLADGAGELASAGESTLDGTVERVGRALNNLLMEHDGEVRKIVERYESRYAQEGVAAWVTLCASLTPWFPSLAPVATVAWAATYLGTKAAESVEKRRRGNTLLGVLAASARRKGAGTD